MTENYKMSQNNSPNLAGWAAIITAIAALITAIGFPSFLPDLVKQYLPKDRDNSSTNSSKTQEGTKDNSLNEPRTSNPNTLPNEFVGVWEGTGLQPIPRNQQYTISLSLETGTTNSIVGNIKYPELSCSGTLTLLKANRTYIVLSENITFGSRCIDNGKINLTLLEPNQIHYFWSHETDNFEVTGKLNKISP